ncbi:MAG: hypothetical protein U9N53_06960 [Bacteroidota bacterium]|nr:hypothetical protein [Bacteroidota bacterium]
MSIFCQIQRFPFSNEVAEKTSAIPLETSPRISITEKEYRELKWEIGCWRGMHSKALLKNEVLKKTIKGKEGQIRDLKNRLFGKKSEKKILQKKKVE